MAVLRGWVGSFRQIGGVDCSIPGWVDGCFEGLDGQFLIAGGVDCSIPGWVDGWFGQFDRRKGREGGKLLHSWMHELDCVAGLHRILPCPEYDAC